jgi:hypothetical protein
MAAQTAEVLARLKRMFPCWSIMRVSRGRGLTAHRVSGEQVWASFPGQA